MTNIICIVIVIQNFTSKEVNCEMVGLKIPVFFGGDFVLEFKIYTIFYKKKKTRKQKALNETFLSVLVPLLESSF